MDDQRLLEILEIVSKANRQDFSGSLATTRQDTTMELLAREVDRLVQGLRKKEQVKAEGATEDVFLLLDNTLRVVSTSEGVYQALNKSADEIVGQPLASLLHEASPDPKSLLQELPKGRATDARIVFSNAHGEPVTFPVTAVQLGESSGDTQQILLFGLHENQKMPREEERSYRQIDRLTRFLHKTASEFKGPISSISGVVNLAKLESQDWKQHRYLDLVNKTTRQMDTIIANIVTFCQNLESGVEAELIDFTLVVTQLLSELRTLEGAEMIKYNLNIDPKVAFYSDVWRVQIILRNLISNAIKYHNLDQEYPTVTVGVKPWEGGVEIMVQDNGPGISKQYHDDIFEMFFKATDKPLGAGLGLFITRNIVEKLGGLIRLKSQTREGSTFTVQLPNLG